MNAIVSHVPNGVPVEIGAGGDPNVIIRPIPPVFPQNGLVAYYKFDGNSTDSVGTRNGTDSMISYSVGKIEQAADFVVSDSSYISMSSFGGLPTGSFTMALWAKVQGANGSIFGWGDYKAGLITVASASSFVFDYEWRRGANVYAAASSFTSSLNEWTHVVIRKSGTTHTLFVNGIGTLSSDTDTIDSQTLYGCGFAFRVTQTISSTPNFTGSLDECAIWNRALSDEEVATVYNYGFGLSL